MLQYYINSQENRWDLLQANLILLEIYKKETHDDGSVIYTHNGVPHRNDGPAIIAADGSQHWYRNGERHRENGPAIEFAGRFRHRY